ncbi:MAG TPA: hypothetical protein ENJ50_05745, partial [Planctomycetaceae bacterium]|nr:hypothetical protein [Planctomycetaceae bacterium]
MKWRLVRELGSARPWNVRDGVELHYPTSVGRSDTGVTLIGDEVGLEKQVPFRFECRTVQVDANGKVLDDTATRGLTDAYGCLSPDGRLALLRRTQWLLEIDDT